MLEFINPTFVLFFVTVTIFCALGVMMVRGFEADEKALFEKLAQLTDELASAEDALISEGNWLASTEDSLASAEKDIRTMAQRERDLLSTLERRDAVASDLLEEIMDLERELKEANTLLGWDTRALSQSFAVDADPYDHETQGL